MMMSHYAISVQDFFNLVKDQNIKKMNWAVLYDGVSPKGGGHS
jgi:hypothetical protein